VKNIVVGIVSSEYTYNRLDELVFNDAFLANREKFDLAVVFNSDKRINHKFKTEFDYTYIRPNVGMDPAGFNHLITNLPEYEYYILLHDDHFFMDNNWLDFSISLMENNPDVDIIGNIVFLQYPKAMQQKFNDFITQIGKENLIEYANLPFYIHGIAGIFNNKSITLLKKKYGGIPHLLNNDKQLAVFCEKLVTLLMIDINIKFAQYPGEIFTYLYHKRQDKLHTYLSEGMRLFYQNDIPNAIKYYKLYLNLAENLKYEFDIINAYINLINSYQILKLPEQIQYYIKKLKRMNLSENIKLQIKEILGDIL